MNKKFILIITSSILFFSIMPKTISYSSVTYNENNCDCNDEKKEHNLNDERELLLIEKNINYLSDNEKNEFKIICENYNKNNSLSSENKIKLAKFKNSIIKNKLGDDYIDFVKIIKKDKNKLTDKEKEKLIYYFDKLQK